MHSADKHIFTIKRWFACSHVKLLLYNYVPLLFLFEQLVLNTASLHVNHKHKDGNNNIDNQYDEENTNHDHWTNNSSNVNRWYRNDC